MAQNRSILAEVFLLCSIFTTAVEAKNADFDELIEMDLQELGQVKVVTATRFEQDIKNSSSIITVITREDILRYGGNSLLDVLQYFPGFVPVGDKAFGLHGATFRGDTNASGEHILTLLDGQPYRSMQTAQDSTGILYKTFPLAAIERIELIHGPGSVIYGTNAMTAVINIITRKGLNDDGKEESVTEVNLQAGSWDTYKQTLHFDTQYNDWLTTVTVENYKTDSWPITDDNTNTAPGTPFDSVNSERQVLHANFENNGFHLRSFLVNNESLFPEFGADAADNNQRYWNIGYQGEKSNWDYAIDLGYLDINNTLTGGETDRNKTLEASANSQVSESLNWLLGISAAKADNHAENLNVDFHQSRYAAYTQFSYYFDKQWTGIAGAQWNKIDGGDTDTSPRIGLIYHHNNYQGLKLFYNEAFRSPTASETDVQFFILTPAPVLIVSGNPNLMSETVTTLDMQWFSYGKQQTFTFGGFYSRYHDRVFQIPFGSIAPGSPLTYINGETIDMWGFELQSKWRFNNKNYFDAGWTWQQNQTESGVADTTLAPRWTANIGYSHNFDNGVVMSLFNQHVSAFGDNGSVTPTPNPESEAYDLLSINTRVPLTSFFPQISGVKADVVFLVQNALDQDIWQPESAVNTTNTFQVQYGSAFYTTLEMAW